MVEEDLEFPEDSVVDCLECNEEGVEWEEVLVIDSDERYACIDLYETFEDLRKTDEENEGCELWYM
jgi:hypothetical protein